MGGVDRRRVERPPDNLGHPGVFYAARTPRSGASDNPSTRSFRKRRRHLPTVCSCTRLPQQPPCSSNHRRNAGRCGNAPTIPRPTRRLRTRRSRYDRSSSLNTTAAPADPHDAPSHDLPASHTITHIIIQTSERDTRLRTHNRNMTVAAMQMALKKVCAQRSYRVAMRRQSLSRPNMRSTRLRCL